MKRLQLLVLASAITAAAIWFFFYRSQHTSNVAVASLLPKETLAFVHLPDLNRSSDEWHRTDLYQLWMEPAVQDFLAKPRSRVPKGDDVGQTVQEMESLEIRDAFVTLVSVEYSAWKIVGGFRCKEGADADKIVAKWRGKLLEDASDLKQETVEYQGRQIQIASTGILNLSTVRAGRWILFGNDLAHLKLLLDRTDGRQKDPQTALSAEPAFLATSKHMPPGYAVLAYARVKEIVEKLAPASVHADRPPADGFAALRQVRDFCATTTFDDRKIRDTLFVGMPKIADLGSLTRASLSLGTPDTFLYAASLLNLTKEMELGPEMSGIGWLGVVQQITNALSANGIGLDEWKSAFGSELSLVGDWPANSRWPALFFTLPVKDFAKASNIVTTMTSTTSGSDVWRHQEKDGIHYFSRPSSGQLFGFSPTVGLSKQILVAGMDTGSTEAAITRTTTGNSGLTVSKPFQEAERALPPPEQSFAYLDPGLIYARFDATLRPFLVMGAAFTPGIADNVDLGKLPPAETITKHLSPLIMSQRYADDGYEAKSIGPLPLYPTMLGSVIATGMYRGFDFGTHHAALPPSSSAGSSPTASPSPSSADSP
jgi:hypothetical protein